jgi:repressor LexA
MHLREIIKSKGIKQSWLASKMGVSKVTMSLWVNEKSYPSKDNLEKLSRILNIPITKLTND